MKTTKTFSVNSHNKVTKVFVLIYKQLLFVWLAFILMTITCYYTIKGVVHESLETEAENTIFYAHSMITSNLLKLEETLQNVSYNTRNLILKGAGADDIHTYMTEITNYLLSEKTGESNLTLVYGYFDIFDGIFINGSGWVPSDDYAPVERPWYKAAVAAGGDIVLVSPYTDANTKKYVITYSQQIFDREGNALGVVCADAQIDKITEFISNMYKSKKGYGLLMNELSEIIIHPNTSYIGHTIYNVNKEFSKLAEHFDHSDDIFKKEVINYKGENAMTFLKKIENDWYIGISIPIKEYNKKAETLKYIIITLGIIFSILLNLILLKINTEKYDSDYKNYHKSKFLAMMSHEIRTPLNAILGISEIQTQNKTLPDNIMEAFDKINDCGLSLLEIINSILDFSKIEANKIEIISAKYDIVSLIEDAVILNMPYIDGKDIEVRLDVDENIPRAPHGDELRIKQIFNNLLSNAFKYTREGKVEISVSAEFDERRNNKNNMFTLVFKVSDTGIGMTDEQINNIFKEYYRFNFEANRAIQGTGLGMNITKHLVQLMNGKILVESEYGKGSTFTVFLHQEYTDAKPIGAESAQNLRRFRFSKSTQTKKTQIIREYMPYGSVLVVDDVGTNLYVAKGLLSPYGLKTDFATSGFEALEKINENKEYDIIFMDHMMPQMDGIETVKRLRKSGYKYPIVALTANAVTGQRDLFLNNGFDEFISKPIDIRELNAILNKFIRDRQPTEVIEKADKEKAVMANSNKLPDDTPPQIDDELFKIFILDAQKAIVAIESTIKLFPDLSADDLYLFTLNVHAMKGSLATIGENELSDKALELEKAGRAQNTSVIYTDAKVFLDSLKKIVEKIKAEAAAAQNFNV